MKKYLSVIILVLALLVSAGCTQQPEHVGIDAKTPAFETLEEMEDACPIIAEVTRLEGGEPIITRTPTGYAASCYTFSQVEITQIHKDSTGTLAVGDIITILENEAFDEENNIVYHTAGYNMMVEGKDYLLFLSQHTLSGRTYHVAAGINWGTVSLDNDGRLTSHRSADNTSISDFSSFTEIWQAARDKYDHESSI